MVQTHRLTFAGFRVTKTYESWSRGEHRREWLMLQHIHRHAPDLVPRPLVADLDADPPTVMMTVVPGEPLDSVLDPSQVDALAVAIEALWALPHDQFRTVMPWKDVLGFAQALTAGPRPEGDLAGAAYDAAVRWWHGPDPELLQVIPSVTVLGHGDANLANYLWDGQRVRIVDLEDAGISDQATELAILVEHLSARELDAEDFCARFDVDPLRLRAARRVWAMFWLRLLLPGGPAARRNPPGTADAQAQRLMALLDER